MVGLCVAAYERGDYEGALAYFAEDVEFDLRHLTPDGEVFHGPQGIRKAFARWQGAFAGHHFEIDELREAGDTVVVLFRERGRGRASGVDTEQHSGGVWRFRDGKVVRMTPYRDREEALRAAGLQ